MQVLVYGIGLRSTCVFSTFYLCLRVLFKAGAQARMRSECRYLLLLIRLGGQADVYFCILRHTPIIDFIES